MDESLSSAGIPDGDKPYTVLSCSMSLDGYISAAGGGRLALSNEADLDRVDAVRARCDAILVGAGTIRSDDARLLVRDPQRVACRVAAGLPATPAKVTVTDIGDVDPGSAFFTTGICRLVYSGSGAADRVRSKLRGCATVVDAGEPVRMRDVCADLYRRGIRRLLVEGGASVHTQFLVDGLADELHLVVAPLFVGDSRARRFVGEGLFPWRPGRRGTLAEVHRIGDVVLLRYALSERFCADAVGVGSPIPSAPDPGDGGLRRTDLDGAGAW